MQRKEVFTCNWAILIFLVLSPNNDYQGKLDKNQKQNLLSDTRYTSECLKSFIVEIPI